MTNVDRLDSRDRPAATYKLVIDHQQAELAERKLREARAALQMAVITGEPADRVGELREAEAAAAAELEACCEPIEFTAMEADAFEELLGQHPPREGTKDEAWDVTTFPKACFLACAPGPWTAKKWEEWAKTKINEGERIKLYNTAINANIRVLDPSVPKDLTEILG